MDLDWAHNEESWQQYNEKKALRWTPQGCRDRGRPKNTWKRTVEKELGNMKLSWSEAESKAQDRAPAEVERQRRRRNTTQKAKKWKYSKTKLVALCDARP